MKNILGLDLGTTSVGWAFIKEAEDENEKSEIVKLGVRVIPLTTDEESDFQKGKAITTNADRTLKRSMRRSLQRYKLRREALLELLKKQEFIKDDTLLSEEGKSTTFSTYKLRADAVHRKIEKEELAKVFLMINKKRGYKSSRKTKGEDEGTAIDSIDIAKELYNKNLTPGQYVYEKLKNGSKVVPDFYRSDLKNELLGIWNFQKQFYPEILTEDLKEKIEDKNKGQTWKICESPFKLVGIKQQGDKTEKRLELYFWRTKALKEKLNLEEIAIVLSEINSQINNSSGYLGAISDRSKKLYFNKQTVGEYLYNQLKANPNTRLKNQAFYRQDYLDEFNSIWEKQAKYYPEMTQDFKEEMRDIIIFYQRKLKSQKGLLSLCQFESWEQEYNDKETGETKKRIIGQNVISKSSPLYQQFKIWQILNNISIWNTSTGEIVDLSLETKGILFKRLNIVSKISKNEFLKLLNKNTRTYSMNYETVEGNKTNSGLIDIYLNILAYEGKEIEKDVVEPDELISEIKTSFDKIGINSKILEIDLDIAGNNFDKQEQMQLWHLLYSLDDNNKVIEKLSEKFGFSQKYAKMISQVHLQRDYGNLSARAIRKILPHLKEGNTFDVACALAGYNHSSSLTKEENESRVLENLLKILPKNSLRNPVVEKILNQMINVINALIIEYSTKDENNNITEYFKFDEIRIELARDLKKSAKERQETIDSIRSNNVINEKIRETLVKEFGIKKVTRNDIIRYKLWQEIESYGYKTLYTNTYVQKEELFSPKFDIDHIIPQSRLFDDSYSNKVLALKQTNIEKGNETAFDYLKRKLNKVEFDQYNLRIEKLYRDGKITKIKFNKLKIKGTEIPEDFIDRDLRDSQYIAKKAKQILFEITRTVNTTTGSITRRLRDDWELVNVMKELNLPKYEKLGMVDIIEGKNGQFEKRIIDWSKRNDHRHHAMDALAVAFTSYSHVQYLNNLNARRDETNKKYHQVYGIEKKYLYRNQNNQLLFLPPIPLNEFRAQAKEHIENILVSFKAKNKVVTRNRNKIKIKGKDKFIERTELTPRGQLHNETIYGKINKIVTKEEKVNATFTLEKINKVAKEDYRLALLKRLEEFDGDPKKAFSGKNAPVKNPIYINDNNMIEIPEKVKILSKEDVYTIRKEISPDLKIEKVVDKGIKRILEIRLDEHGGDSKKAFSNLEENPIWLNKEKGISIKRVKITGVSNAEPLHWQKDHNGEFILDENSNKIPVDFVNTGNNHHVAIYRDNEGNLQEDVVSFLEAVHRKNEGLPIINKNKNDWEFLFTMKQNEYFIFPSEDFDPNEYDLLDEKNKKLIAPHLFRVQKISTKNYVFNNHLETKAVDGELLKTKKQLAGIGYIFIQTPSKLEGIVKVRINHIGKIVKVGE